jgi:hypothetical protein
MLAVQDQSSVSLPRQDQRRSTGDATGFSVFDCVPCTVIVFPEQWVRTRILWTGQYCQWRLDMAVEIGVHSLARH